MFLADKCFVCGHYDKILMETGKFSGNTSVTEKWTRVLCRKILRFKTSAIDLIQSEKVSTLTSFFFAHRLAFSSHAFMIIPKFWCHKYETGSLYFGPFLKRSRDQFNVTDGIEIICHYIATRSVQKLYIRAVARWGFWERPWESNRK